jgi:hypothetical protein
MSPDAVSLITSMIVLDPSERLGCTLESIKVLKEHPFFEGVDFEEVSREDYKGCV